jgi:hypothetical protein
MKDKYIKNKSASIRQRLLNLAKETNRPFQEVLQYFAIERFLFRLSNSQYVNRFILKGGLVLQIWQGPQARATKDIDMLGHVTNTIDKLISIVSECMSIEINDGLKFDPSSVRGEEITKDAEYKGVRICFTGNLENARLNLSSLFHSAL